MTLRLRLSACRNLLLNYVARIVGSMERATRRLLQTSKAQVHGIGVDGESRCAHYHTPLDIVAIKMRCCGVYYACKDCHIALADHEIERWPANQWKEKAILCGACGNESTIHAYLAGGYQCPTCTAAFNPGCRHHYRFYFEDLVPAQKGDAG